MKFIVSLIGLLALGCLGLAGCGQRTEGWKQADLERNRLDLGLYRMREAAYGQGMTEQRLTGRELSGWVKYGEVVDAGGSSRLRDGGDLYVLVRYEISQSGFLGTPEPPRAECWRFTTADGYDVTLDQADCP